MATTYGFSSFAEIWDSILADLGEDDRLSGETLDKVKQWILEACERLTQRIPISRERELLLVQDQEDYRFADSTEPRTGTGTVGVADLAITGVTGVGTGTISTDNTATDEGLKVTGVGTAFKTELAIGEAIIVGTEIKEILSIESNTILYVDAAFDASLSADAFTYSTTKFTRELVEGSIVVINAETRIIDEVTDAYNATVTVPFAADAAAQTFTVDTVVDEIPTEFFRIYKIDRLEGGARVEIKVDSLENLLAQRRDDGTLYGYSNQDIPCMAAPWTDGTGKFLKMYQPPDAHKQCTIYSFIRIKPSLHLADAFTDDIPLQEDYDSIIKEYVKGKVKESILKDKEGAKEHKIEFERAIQMEIATMPVNRTLQVNYS